MASKALTTSAFMEKLLAPLPVSELNSKAYTEDMVRDWRISMQNVEYAAHGHWHEAIGLRLSIVGHTEHVSRQCFRKYCDAIGDQCLVPAPTAKEMRWKKRNRHLTGGRADVAEAIARDEARLAA